MAKANEKKSGCPSETELELYLLDPELRKSSKGIEIKKHLEHCSHCMEIYKELSCFYELLRDELKKPVSEKILKLVEKIYEKDSDRR